MSVFLRIFTKENLVSKKESSKISGKDFVLGSTNCCQMQSSLMPYILFTLRLNIFISAAHRLTKWKPTSGHECFGNFSKTPGTRRVKQWHSIHGIWQKAKFLLCRTRRQIWLRGHFMIQNYLKEVLIRWSEQIFMSTLKDRWEDFVHHNLDLQNGPRFKKRGYWLEESQAPWSWTLEIG